ncbi:MAG: hypothetical protein H6739_36615 [Alphaproteobacteria bacterium]|nr:hypothetical protein [Alphaproteobacteria bacterium]
MTVKQIHTLLTAIESDPYLMLSGDTAPVEPIVSALLEIDPDDLSVRLLRWSLDAPSAVTPLLEAVAKEPTAATHVSKALVRQLTAWNRNHPDDDAIDSILIQVFPTLIAPFRDWTAERPLVRAHFKLIPGKEYVHLGPVDQTHRLNPGQRAPPPLTPAGAQVRLLDLDYNCGPITGEWNDATLWALNRYRYECYLPMSDTVDDETLEHLASNFDDTY